MSALSYVMGNGLERFGDITMSTHFQERVGGFKEFSDMMYLGVKRIQCTIKIVIKWIQQDKTMEGNEQRSIKNGCRPNNGSCWKF